MVGDPISGREGFGLGLGSWLMVGPCSRVRAQDGYMKLLWTTEELEILGVCGTSGVWIALVPL